MIKNDRQLKVSCRRAEELRAALTELNAKPVDPTLHADLRPLQTDALNAQLGDIEEEICDYTELVENPPRMITVDSLHELPRALIRARIAAGLTHRALADRLGLKEQAIQRYEATDYCSANFIRLTEVADALGVRVTQELHLADGLSSATLLKRLRTAGIDTRLLERRLLAPGDRASALGPDETIRLAADVERIFGWSTDDLRSNAQLEPAVGPKLAASFKKQVNAPDAATTAYVVYAHYLALQVASLVNTEFRRPPVDWQRVRSELGNDVLDLRSVVNYAWDLGIAVLPLQDRIAIHGAYWNLGDRGAIVMKQGTRSCSRWLFDLWHELYHAATDEDGTIDLGSDDDIEVEANTFAANVLSGGRSEELMESAVKRASGKMERLKWAASELAASEGLQVGILANLLAWRLSLQGEDWWGVANNLQRGEDDPWEICRDVLLERADLDKLNSSDRRLVLAALRDDRDDHE